MCEKTTERKTRLLKVKHRSVDDTNTKFVVLRSVDWINLAWGKFQLQAAVDA
jgi:hypothetical protein